MEAQMADPTTWEYVVGFVNYILTTINLWAVLVAGVSSMFLGGLWYGPLFGKLWMKLMGIDKKKMAKMMKDCMPMWLSYLLMFIGSLIMALILALILDGLRATTIVQSLVVSFLIWLGFVMPITLGSVLWEGKSFKLFFLNSAYNIINIFVVATILVSWVKA